MYFLCICAPRFNVDFKCSYTLDYIAALIRSPIYALHGLAVRAIQFSLFSSWIAQEDNAAKSRVAMPTEKRERYRCYKPGKHNSSL
jgi:hypothetical protein